MNWRWWFRIGINPEPRHDLWHWVRSFEGPIIARPEFHRRQMVLRANAVAQFVMASVRSKDEIRAALDLPLNPGANMRIVYPNTLLGMPLVYDEHVPPGTIYFGPGVVRFDFDDLQPADEDGDGSV